MTSGQALFYNTDMPHDVSNTAYEVAATRIWPILLIQSPKRSVLNGTSITSVRMSCLKATNATPGSEKIGDVPRAGSWVGYNVLGLISVMAITAFVL